MNEALFELLFAVSIFFISWGNAELGDCGLMLKKTQCCGCYPDCCIEFDHEQRQGSPLGESSQSEGEPDGTLA
jgi:hypothetical protein